MVSEHRALAPRALALIACTLFAVTAFSGVSALVYEYGGCAADASSAGSVLTDQPGLFTSASWHFYSGPGGCPATSPAAAGRSDAIITTSYGAPTGADFTILTTGDAQLADDPNTSGSSGYGWGASHTGGN
ncbi:MAG TPA: hypothetical protein VGR28_13120, partial [Candidatus Thermoplasmatota archaeon]|nr:hypothetical protein [Candidatus Thermoplasmatota archaeon]